MPILVVGQCIRELDLAQTSIGEVIRALDNTQTCDLLIRSQKRRVFGRSLWSMRPLIKGNSRDIVFLDVYGRWLR